MVGTAYLGAAPPGADGIDWATHTGALSVAVAEDVTAADSAAAVVFPTGTGPLSIAAADVLTAADAAGVQLPGAAPGNLTVGAIETAAAADSAGLAGVMGVRAADGVSMADAPGVALVRGVAPLAITCGDEAGADDAPGLAEHPGPPPPTLSQWGLGPQPPWVAYSNDRTDSRTGAGTCTLRFQNGATLAVMHSRAEMLARLSMSPGWMAIDRAGGAEVVNAAEIVSVE